MYRTCNKYFLIFLSIACSSVSSFADDSVATLVARLATSPPQNDRLEIRTKVLQMGPRVIPKLIRSMDSEDEKVRVEAADLLGQIWPCPHRGATTLARHLNDEDQGVREASFRSLLLLGAQAELAIPTLIPLLNNELPEVRIAAANIIKAIGPSAAKALPALHRSFNDSNAEVREAVAGAVELVSFGHLANLIQTGNSEKRILAAEALGRTKSPKAEAALLDALDLELKKEVSDEFVIDEIIFALGRRKSIKSAPKLVQIIKTDPRPNLRAVAAEALATIASNESIGALLRGLEDPSPEARNRVLSALGDMQHKATIPRVVAALSDPDTRIAAAKTLELFGPEASVSLPVLKEFFTREENSPRALAAEESVEDWRLEEVRAVALALKAIGGSEVDLLITFYEQEAAKTPLAEALSVQEKKEIVEELHKSEPQAVAVPPKLSLEEALEYCQTS